MRKFIAVAVCVGVVWCLGATGVQAAMTTDEARVKYTPQSSPGATFLQELEMMSQGTYCYDLPIFDPQWRRRGGCTSIPYGDQQQYRDFQTYIEGEYAVLYYPQHKGMGPVFLYRENGNWIVDRTCVIDNIHYSPDNSYWIAYDGAYPYLALLQKVFALKKGTSGDRPVYTRAD